MSLAKKVKGESIALKAKVSKAIENEESEDEPNRTESDEEFALFVKKFNKFMRKKKGQLRKAQTSRRNVCNDRKCFECGEPGHIAINFPSKKNKGKDVNDKKKKSSTTRRGMAKPI
jgi:6-phosphogluconolactonase/glucosamine-6-phosphate isomerase/deaminase